MNMANDEGKVNFPAVIDGSIGSETVQTVNARDLHAFLEVGKDFSTWMKDRINQYGFIEGQDFIEVFPGFGENSSGGRPAREYHISLDMAKELSMVERNEKGKQARQYFIEMERRAKAGPMVTLDFKDPAVVLGVITTLQQEVEATKAQVIEYRPKAEAYDHLMNAEGLYGLQNAGRALGARPNLFIRWLKQDFLFYQGLALVPRVQFIQRGLFEVRTTIVDDKARPTTFVTPKGLDYLRNRVPGEYLIGGAA